ncbi:hypothetical protein HRR83_005340 [Exophiala dermatitidis]|uniref:Uncharacterized protein n=1 Tax=Exophiala dermatitidis TaxID=5970 RepID=A0AAN6EUN5_EXODE|nr:hypothetical protein HRR74_005193 [Exophiala dermatitidis]KAJ4518559.1 hypothetical protein HRR73_004140 [Exophiala dermatitidis]KAJ4534060.1 hypothetical protein HRR76_006005 [Exophiala dermatitidis]KAJ4550216.1 hypothetical protein HRR77_003691 [Exophiala dermatitidis]KAJ4571539.1 hypothetical protein HRR81_005570 [Exophiala dermatitidis]
MPCSFIAIHSRLRNEVRDGRDGFLRCIRPLPNLKLSAEAAFPILRSTQRKHPLQIVKLDKGPCEQEEGLLKSRKAKGCRLDNFHTTDSANRSDLVVSESIVSSGYENICTNLAEALQTRPMPVEANKESTTIPVGGGEYPKGENLNQFRAPTIHSLPRHFSTNEWLKLKMPRQSLNKMAIRPSFGLGYLE